MIDDREALRRAFIESVAPGFLRVYRWNDYPAIAQEWQHFIDALRADGEVGDGDEYGDEFMTPGISAQDWLEALQAAWREGE